MPLKPTDRVLSPGNGSGANGRVCQGKTANNANKKPSSRPYATRATAICAIKARWIGTAIACRVEKTKPCVRRGKPNSRSGSTDNPRCRNGNNTRRSCSHGRNKMRQNDGSSFNAIGSCNSRKNDRGSDRKSRRKHCDSGKKNSKENSRIYCGSDNRRRCGHGRSKARQSGDKKSRRKRCDSASRKSGSNRNCNAGSGKRS